MAHHLIPNPGPHIETPTTRSILDSLDRLAKRDPEVGLTVDAVRGGDNERLMQLVRTAQDGDADAALIAIGALLPRLCKVVISRRPPNRWKPSINEYLTLAFLAIADVKPGESPAYFAEKLISRTRLRHERQLVVTGEVPLDLVPEPAYVGNDVEEQVLARLEVAVVAEAVRTGHLNSDDLTEVALAALADRSGKRSDAARQHLARTRRRLARSWPGELGQAA